MIERLQKVNFKWEDKPYNELIKEYPDSNAALKWWCNEYGYLDNGRIRNMNIGNFKYLKGFLIANPPTFKISSKCCKYAKKDVGKSLIKKYNADLMIIGVRKAEGGIRASAYKNCITINDTNVDNYRPLFWYSDDSKKEYETKFNIKHSACYTKYGFERTGCCCCPYGKELEEELMITEIFEPNLYKAVRNVFKETYEYTRKYREYVQLQRLKLYKPQIEGQMTIDEFIEV